MGLTALTAASFCVVLTLEETFETATFFAADLRANGFAAALRAGLTVFLGFAAAFFAGRAFAAAFRAGALAVTALRAFGLDGAFALTTRFAVFADAVLAFDREAERLKPFVRLLLMCGSQKAARLMRAAVESPGEYHTCATKSTDAKYLQVL